MLKYCHDYFGEYFVIRSRLWKWRGADPSSSYSSSLTGSAMMVDALSESQTRMIRGLLACLTRLVALQFKNVQEPS